MMTRRARRRTWIVLGLLAVPFLVEGALTGAMVLLGKQRGVKYHENYGWRPYANIARSGPMWGRDRPAHTNSAGWRDAERRLDRAEKDAATTLRVAAIGDSFTFGVGVDDGERFTEMIEADLPAVEVLNFGMNGFGTDQELEVLRHEVLDYRPDVVLCVTYLGNDLLDITHSVRHRWPKPRYELVDGALRLQPPEADFLLRLRSATYIGEAISLLRRRLGQEQSQVQEPCEDPLALYLALVEAMVRAAEGAGARLVVTLVHEPDIDSDLALAVRAGLAERGVPMIDLEPSFTASMAAGDVLFNPPPVAHWNVRGHRLVATEVAEGLRRLGVLPGQ